VRLSARGGSACVQVPLQKALLDLDRAPIGPNGERQRNRRGDQQIPQQRKPEQDEDDFPHPLLRYHRTDPMRQPNFRLRVRLTGRPNVHARGEASNARTKAHYPALP
jgi:hypothetical protein